MYLYISEGFLDRTLIVAVHHEKSDQALRATETGVLVMRNSMQEQENLPCGAQLIVCCSYLYLESTDSQRHLLVLTRGGVAT